MFSFIKPQPFSYLLLAIALLCHRAQSQSQTYFTTPYQDTGTNFSASMFSQVMAVNNGYVTLGISKTIQLGSPCSGVVASFKNENGVLQSFHRYYSCDSIAFWQPTAVKTADNHLVIALAASGPSDVSDLISDAYYYFIKVDLSNPINYTAHRITIPDAEINGYSGFSPSTEKSSRIVLHPNGDYSVLIPSADRMLLCRVDPNFNILHTVRFQIPFQSIDRIFNVATTSLLLLPDDGVLVNAYYDIGIPLVEGGMMISRVDNSGNVIYNKTYESSSIAGAGMLSIVNQMQLVNADGMKVLAAAHSQKAASLQLINAITGDITSAKYLFPPSPIVIDSNNYIVGNTGIVKVNNDFLVNRIIANPSPTIPIDQLGVMKIDSNLNLIANKKYSFRGVHTHLPDGRPLPCVSNDGTSIVVTNYSNGLSTDSTFGDSGELLFKTNTSGLTTSCPENTYNAGDVLMPESPLNPFTFSINISTENLSTIQVPINHDYATAFWQRNVCLPIPPGTPTAVNEIDDEMKINIFPNPVNNELTIQSKQDFITADIFNIAGIKVKVVLLHRTNKINCTDLVNGLYILKLRNKNGKTYVQKFSKQ